MEYSECQLTLPYIDNELHILRYSLYSVPHRGHVSVSHGIPTEL